MLWMYVCDISFYEDIVLWNHEYCIILRDEFCYGKPLNTVVRIIINVMAYIYIYNHHCFLLWKSRVITTTTTTTIIIEK
jgi:hypothetical protein